MRDDFDFEAALSVLQDGQKLMGKDGILTPLTKQLTEAAPEAEMAVHLQTDEASNRKNGYGRKTVKSTTGSFELATPHDRSGSFEPQLVKEHQTHMSDEIERKFISMFGLGMRYRRRRRRQLSPGAMAVMNMGSGQWALWIKPSNLLYTIEVVVSRLSRISMLPNGMIL